MFLYIDPGTGSMLFTILIGVLGAGIYLLRNVFSKIKFIFTGGKRASGDDGRADFAVFTDSKRYWNVFKPIMDEMERRGQKVLYLTASPDDAALNENYEHITAKFAGEGNKAFARMNMLKADVVLSSTPGLDVYQWKRSRDVSCYVHIPHAASDITIYRMFGIDYYDAVMVSGDYQREQIRKLEALRGLPEKDVPLIGITYMDEMKKRLDSAPPIEKTGRTVLLAPSWGPSSIFSKYGGRIIDALVKTDNNIVIRPHPQSFTSENEMLDALIEKYPESDRLIWDRSTDNFEVLRRADILISDFSGVIFDFMLVFDKPVIYADTEFDTSVYDAWWLDEELWTFKTLEKTGVKLNENDFDDIGRIIDSCIDSETFGAERERARMETWANIGSAASLAADYLIAMREKVVTTREKDAEKTAKKQKTNAEKHKAEGR
ncbi:MAG: CDP-glycerol glycerophosphotransferase family protein [Clostridia bacterium]|nr:CDP-glycerol glycerophosphotransferase family protein [Clostridia bacterium]